MGLFEYTAKKLILKQEIYKCDDAPSILFEDKIQRDESEHPFSKFFYEFSQYRFVNNISVFANILDISDEALEIMATRKIAKSKYIILPFTCFMNETKTNECFAFIQEDTYVPDFKNAVKDSKSFFKALQKVVLEMDKLGLSTSKLDHKDFSTKKSKMNKVVFSNFTKLEYKKEDEDVLENLKNIISDYFVYIRDEIYNKNTMYLLFGKVPTDYFLSNVKDEGVELNQVIESITTSKDMAKCETCGTAYDQKMFDFCPVCFNIVDYNETKVINDEFNTTILLKLSNELKSVEFIHKIVDFLEFHYSMQNINAIETKILFNYDEEIIEGFVAKWNGTKVESDRKSLGLKNLFSYAEYLERKNLDIGINNAYLITSKNGYNFSDIKYDEFKVSENENESLIVFRKAIFEYFKENTKYYLDDLGHICYNGSKQIFNYGFKIIKEFEKYILTGEIPCERTFKDMVQDAFYLTNKLGQKCSNEFEVAYARSFTEVSEIVYEDKENRFTEKEVKISGSEDVYIYRVYEEGLSEYVTEKLLNTAHALSYAYTSSLEMSNVYPKFRLVLSEEYAEGTDVLLQGFLYEKEEHKCLAEFVNDKKLSNKEKLLVFTNAFALMYGLAECNIREFQNSVELLFANPELVSNQTLDAYIKSYFSSNLMCVDANFNVYLKDFYSNDQVYHYGLSTEFKKLIEETMDETSSDKPYEIAHWLKEKYESLTKYCSVHNYYFSESDVECPKCYPNSVFVDKSEFTKSKFKFIKGKQKLERDKFKFSDNNYEIYYSPDYKKFDLFHFFKSKDTTFSDEEILSKVSEIAKTRNDVKIIRAIGTKEILGYTSKYTFRKAKDFAITEWYRLKGNIKYQFIYQVFKSFLSHQNEIPNSLAKYDLSEVIKPALSENGALLGYVVSDIFKITRFDEEKLTDEGMYEFFYSLISSDATFKTLSSELVDKDVKSLYNIIIKLYNKYTQYCAKHNICYQENSLCPICYKSLKGRVKVFDSTENLEPFKDGAEANVYLTDEEEYVQKIFNKYSVVGGKKKLTVDLKKKIIIILRLMEKAEVVNFENREEGFVIFTPKFVTVDKATNKANGYWMEKLPEDSSPFIHLTDASFVEKKGYTREFILLVLLNFAKAIEFLHQNGMYIGDISGTNVHFDEKGIVYIIDADSNGIDEFKSVMYTSVFTDPNALSDDGSLTTSPLTDWYSYAIIAFMCLFRVHPFKGIYFEEVEGNKKLMPTEDRMKNKISVLNPEHNVKIPSIALPFDTISEELLGAFLKLFETDERFSLLNLMLKEYSLKVGGTMPRYSAEANVTTSEEEVKKEVIEEQGKEEVVEAKTYDNPNFNITEITKDSPQHKEYLGVIEKKKNFETRLVSKNQRVSLNMNQNKALVWELDDPNCYIYDIATIDSSSGTKAVLPSKSLSLKNICYFGNNIYYCKKGKIYGININTGKQARWTCEPAEDDSILYNNKDCFYLESGPKLYCLSPK